MMPWIFVYNKGVTYTTQGIVFQDEEIIQSWKKVYVPLLNTIYIFTFPKRFLKQIIHQ